MTKKYIEYVEIALRCNNIALDKELLSKVIATVELIQNKGDKATLKDTVKLKYES
jgi:hypothetical protein